MHPIFQNRNSVLAYLAAWFPLGAVLAYVIKASARLGWLETAAFTAPLTLVLAVVCLSPWYLARSLPLSSSSRAKVLGTNLIAAMCASAVVMAAAHVLLSIADKLHPGLSGRIDPALPIVAGMLFLFYLLSIAMHYVLLALETSKRAELLSREAEFKALKAQVNPHFLFNSLNSISALTSVDAAKARQMCIRLSDFLRNSLRLGEKTSIPFGEEMELTNTYLDVEQVRFGRRLRVKQDFAAECAFCEVPPLLVQPLVENAIKHGIAALTEGGEIAMTARVERGQLRFTVENPFDPDAPSMKKSGFGLVNVRSRLAARYGGAARLEVQVELNLYRVILSLPCGDTVKR
jgi:two-component system, LytTR family, sensor histidine kinase AlgZ